MFTPTKFSDHIISPFSHQCCLLCFKNVNEYKTPKDHIENLFHPNGQKREFCEILEEYLNVQITIKDLKIICRSCFKSVLNDLKHQADKKLSLLKIRGTVEERRRRGEQFIALDIVNVKGVREQMINNRLSRASWLGHDNIPPL